MEKNITQQKAIEFAVKIVRLCNNLRERSKEFTLSNQYSLCTQAFHKKDKLDYHLKTPHIAFQVLKSSTHLNILFPQSYYQWYEQAATVLDVASDVTC